MIYLLFFVAMLAIDKMKIILIHFVITNNKDRKISRGESSLWPFNFKWAFLLYNFNATVVVGIRIVCLGTDANIIYGSVFWMIC